MRIAIDAMGGDYAPEETVRGAYDAAPQVPDATIVLVGRTERVQAALAACGPRPGNLEIQQAGEVIEMHEDPRRALLRKRDSSIHIGLGMVKHSKADAFISAGNTGALVGGATVPVFGLGCLEGVKRPAITVPMPTENGFAALVDAGANKECKPIHLLQWAVMASVYVKYLRKDVTEPKVALLNIGEERNKGTALIQEAYALLEHGDRGVAEAAVLEARILVLEARLGLLGAVVDEALRQEHGFRRLAELRAQRSPVHELRLGRPLLRVCRPVVVHCHAHFLQGSRPIKIPASRAPQKR